MTPLDECAVAGCRPNDVRIVGAPVLCLFLFIAFAGDFYFNMIDLYSIDFIRLT